MSKTTLKTKAAKGINNGDVANAMVRNLLTLLSREIGEISDEQLEETIKFFDGKCPYTGVPMGIKDLDHITDSEKKNIKKEFQLDHIIPLNRKNCGLNLFGNLVFVTNEANSKKGSKSFEDFIMNNHEVEGLKDADDKTRKQRVQKIKEFQEKYYRNYINLKDVLSVYLEEEYQSIAKRQNERIEKIKDVLKR